LLKAAAVGSVTAAGLLGIERASARGTGEQQPGNGSGHAHDNRPLTDKRALAVASFGQWDGDPAVPFDRQPINTNTENRVRNVHLMLPYEVDVDAGGAVSFVISGVHQLLVYGPGRELEDVQAGAAGLPPIAGAPPLVEYATDRVYRGLDPRVLQYLALAAPPPDTPNNLVVDRVESVRFKEPGRYLVVCGVLPHFNEGMHGYVNVKA
jgi:plastocyanin